MKNKFEKPDIRKALLPELQSLQEKFAVDPFTTEDIQSYGINVEQGALDTLVNLGYLSFNEDLETYSVTEEGLTWIDANQSESDFVDGDEDNS